MPDPYSVLGVARDADEDAIKKAYKKMALKWHPDKNPDNKEMAEKKFKAVTAAFKLLSDPNERAHYDRYGDERPQGGGMPRRNPYGGHGGGVYAEELTPEDIFNMFFGMPPRGHQGRPPQQHRQHHHQHHRRADVEMGNVSLMQLAPFGLILLLSLASSLPFGGEQTPYALRPQDSYVLERSTEALGVAYYVADTFELRHSDARTLRELEERVESDALQRVRRRCHAERMSKQKMIDAANSYQGAERARMYESADTASMYWCDEKDRLEAAGAR